jgi:hypothetical protein
MTHMQIRIPAQQPTHLITLSDDWAIWPVAAVRSAGMPFGLLQSLAMPELLDMPPGDERDTAIRAACAENIDRILCTDAIEEAMTWQNPSLAETWMAVYVASLKAGGPARVHNRAYKESVVARYAQRYCAKNESIGFFGPVAWARLTDDLDGLRWTRGAGCRSRSAYLEVWAVAEVAEAWSRDPQLLPYLPVRLDPAASWDGQGLRLPRRPPRPLDPVDAAIVSALSAAPGTCRAGDLAARAVTMAGVSPAAVMAAIIGLRDRGVLQLGFLVPITDEPEEHLRRQVEDLPGHAPGRTEMLRHIARLSAARQQASAARGAAQAYRAIKTVSGCLAEAADGTAALQRRAPYARTPVYLDSRRDLDVHVGADLIDPLRAPLTILLDSARWLTTELAREVHDELRRQYRRLRAAQSVVTLSDLQFAASRMLATGEPAVGEVEADFHLRWAEILSHRPAAGPGAQDPGHAAPSSTALPPGRSGEVRLCSASIRPLAQVLFPAGRPGWAASRQHAPDLMLRRSRDGSLHWVIGELHVGVNTLESRLFRTQCDAPGELVSCTAADMSGGRVVPLYPHNSPAVSSRTYPPLSLDPPGLYTYWSYASDQGHSDGIASTAGSAILVEEKSNGDIVGRADAGGWEALAVEFFGEFITSVAVNLFHIQQPSEHNPRVSIDDVVVSRESWSAPAAEISVPKGRSDDYTYAALRAWAASRGMPRHLFVKTPLEIKPFYVDLASPLLMGLLSRIVRRASSAGNEIHIDFTEMCPAPDELWLDDAEGNRYTAEFRIVGTDQRAEWRSGNPVVKAVSR